MLNLTYAKAVENAAHLIALGETTVHLYGRDGDDKGFPFDKVTRVETGSCYRLNGPSGCYLVAEDAGLTFKLSVDFETRDANGRGVALFERDRLREVMLKLPDEGRRAFATMLRGQVLTGLQARTNEIREALRQQSDSEDCVLGLIAFAEAESVPA